MQPRATGNKHRVGHKGSGDSSSPSGTEEGVSRAGSLGGGTDEEQASRWMSRACCVPVSIAEEVTKTILSSPKVLTASSDRCYCPRQSNTTVWIRRGGKKKNKKTRRREYRQFSV